MPHPISSELFKLTENFARKAPLSRCEHLTKSKQQFYVTFFEPDELKCRECAKKSMYMCIWCGEIQPTSMFFILSYLRGPTGNDPNYFIANVCDHCANGVPEGQWGVKLLELRREDGVLLFMHVQQSTTKTFPPLPVAKKKKDSDDDLE